MTRRRSALLLLSIVVAALAIWLWLRNFDISVDAFSQLFARLRWWPVLLLFCLLTEHVALSSWRWSIIEVRLGGERPRFSHAFAAGAFSLGLGTFLPSPLVNVACRSLANRISGTSGLRGVISGGIDQLADLAVVVLVAIPAVIALLRHDLDFYIVGAPAMALLGLGLIAILPAIVQAIFPLFLIPGLDRIAPLVDRSLLLKLYGISMLRVVNLTLMTLAIHAATGTATVAAVVVGVPLVTLAISAAMLPGALGVSEWSFAAVFSSFGVARSDIVLFVLANRIVLTALSLALALLVLLVMVRARLGAGKEA